MSGGGDDAPLSETRVAPAPRREEQGGHESPAAVRPCPHPHFRFPCSYSFSPPSPSLDLNVRQCSRAQGATHCDRRY